MPNFEVGTGAALCIDWRDETRISTKYNLQDGREALEDTTFQAPGYAKEYAYGLMSGAASNGGFLSLDKNVVVAQMATVVGKNRLKHRILIGPSGLLVGNEACFFETLQNSFNVEKSVSGLTTADAAYATNRSGIRDGVCLHSLHGDASLGGNEKARLVFADADPNQYFGLRAAGANGTAAADLVTFRLADYATDAALIAALKTKIEALTAYAGRMVTLTVVTPRSGAAALSLVIQIEWDGRANVPDLQAISGAVSSFVVNGGNSGNYSVNGGAAFTLPVSEGALQTNQRNLGGQFAGVVVKGSSVGNTASGERHTVAGNGNTFTIYGDIVVNLAANPTPTLATVEAAVRAKAGRASAVVSGTLTPPVNGPVNGYRVSGAGTASVNGNYADTGETANGQKIYQNANGVRFGYTTLGGDNYYVLYEGGGIPRSYSSSNYFASTPTGAYTTGSDGTSPVPTVAETYANATLGSASITITYDASAGNVADIEAVPGAGYAGTSVQPNPNGSANFRFYYPLTAAPGAPTVNGTGATIARTQAAGTASPTLGTPITQGGAASDQTYNIVSASGADDWVDAGAASASGVVFRSHLISLGDNATVAVILEHADGTDAGPNAATVATIATHNYNALGAQESSDNAATVQRWTRCRYVLTGTQAVFTAALAR